MDELKIADKVARSVTSTGKWSWEIQHVDGLGVLWQLLYNTGTRFVKWTDLVKVVKEFGGRVSSDVWNVAKAGLPINTAKIEVGDIEVVVETGKVEVFVNVKVEWVAGAGNVTIDSVEELMLEGGMK